MGSLEARNSKAAFIEVLSSSVVMGGGGRNGTPDEELERGLDEDENTAVADVDRKAMETAAGRALRSNHRASLNASKEFEAVLNGFTFPLVKHFADAGAK